MSNPLDFHFLFLAMQIFPPGLAFQGGGNYLPWNARQGGIFEYLKTKNGNPKDLT